MEVCSKDHVEIVFDDSNESGCPVCDLICAHDEEVDELYEEIDRLNEVIDELRESLQSPDDLLNLYIVRQSVRTGYDTFDSFLCAAKDIYQATTFGPTGQNDPEYWSEEHWDWCDSPDEAVAEWVGKAGKGAEPGVLMSSFNAG